MDLLSISGRATDTEPEVFPLIPHLLPLEKLYTIQMGHKTFQLSGASLSSDLPSYFTEYFLAEDRQTTTLMIDRSPEVFLKIQHHLQGYRITIDSPEEFAYLFADAHYYQLPQLKELIHTHPYLIRVGEREFRIPRKLLQGPGNASNLISLSWEASYRDPRSIVALRDMLRPPAFEALRVEDRSADLFLQLIDLLAENPVAIRDAAHRAALILECRYYNLKGLEQAFVRFRLWRNPFTLRDAITIGSLSDIHTRSLLNPTLLNDPTNEEFAPIMYRRPHVDTQPHRDLVLQITAANNETARLSVDTINSCVFLKLSPEYSKLYLSKVGALLPNKEDIILSESGEEVFIVCDLESCHCTINEKAMPKNWLERVTKADVAGLPLGKHVMEFKLLASQWYLHARGSRVVARGVKMEGVSDMFHLYARGEFLQ